MFWNMKKCYNYEEKEHIYNIVMKVTIKFEISILTYIK